MGTGQVRLSLALATGNPRPVNLRGKGSDAGAGILSVLLTPPDVSKVCWPDVYHESYLKAPKHHQKGPAKGP